MNPQLTRALQPVLRDLCSCQVQPVIEPYGRQDDGDDGDQRWVLFRDADGSAAGAGVRLGFPPAEQVRELADQAQEWAVEALNRVGLSAVWPECPWHPRSHPLSAGVDGDRAVWRCPRDEREAAEIGRL